MQVATTAGKSCNKCYPQPQLKTNHAITPKHPKTYTNPPQPQQKTHQTNFFSTYSTHLLSSQTPIIKTIHVIYHLDACPSSGTQSALLKSPPPPRMNPNSRKNGGEWTRFVIGRRLFWRHRIDCWNSRVAAAAAAAVDVAGGDSGCSSVADAEVAALCRRLPSLLSLWDGGGGLGKKCWLDLLLYLLSARCKLYTFVGSITTKSGCYSNIHNIQNLLVYLWFSNSCSLFIMLISISSKIKDQRAPIKTCNFLYFRSVVKQYKIKI